MINSQICTKCNINIPWVILLLFFLLPMCQSVKKSGETTPSAADTNTVQSASYSGQNSPHNSSTSEFPLSDDGVSGQWKNLGVDSLLAKMTLKEKIGQLFFIRANGTFLNREDERFLRLKELIQDYHVGGITFFRGDIYDQVMLTNRLQEISRIPLWITQDMEYGAAMRVESTTRFTPNMGIAATQTPEYAYHVGRTTAKEAQALGVHQIFAPVLDVNNNPENPVINVRSYGGNPEIVSKYGLQFIDGVQNIGLISTAKHFPGHGDTNIDSHSDLPILDFSYSRLDSLELRPFNDAISHGVPSVMSAHIALPEISKNIQLPSTLDPKILHNILLDTLNFNGLVVTDALEMRGVSSYFSPGSAVIKSLQAGADVMLLSPDITTAVHEVYRAVESGVIEEKRIDRSVRKLLKLKMNFGLFENRLTNIDNLSRSIGNRSDQLLSQKIARESITVLKNEGDILPITNQKFPKVLLLSIADNSSGQTGSYLARRIRDYHNNVTFRILDKRTSKEDKKEIIEDAKEADLIILGSFIFVQTGKEIQLSDEQKKFLNKITKTDAPSALVAFGNPYVVSDLSNTEAHIMAWSGNRLQVDATVPALFGASNISGRLPITIPGLYNMGDGLNLEKTILRPDEPEVAGMNPDSLRRIDDLLNKAIFDSVFPGATVAVARSGILAYHSGHGYHTYKKVKKVRTGDIYDLASLTKIAATTTAVMKLVDEGKLDINDRVSKYITAFESDRKNKIKIKNLLLHNSGLPPFKVYVDKYTNRKDILNAIKKENLVAKPYEQYIYSDLGFIMLAHIVEEVTGQRLDEYMKEHFYEPMDLTSTLFNPTDRGSWIKNRIPPTEIDTLFRKDTVHAVVHDERAYYMDGVAGHAGLFSSAKDMAAFGQMLLNKGSYAGKQFIKSDIVEEFTSRRSNLNNRGYGFDRKSEGFSTAGTLTSEQTFGHLGFTGTSLWVDPENELVVVLLSNRTWPYRNHGNKMNQIRAEIADIAVSSIE